MSLSEERTRQICNETDLNEFYRKLEDGYRTKITEADYNWLKTETAHLRRQNRSKTEVIRRKLLIKYLHDKLDMPFYRIGQLLKRHHTSVTNLYYQV